jgi:hypothetical protein
MAFTKIPAATNRTVEFTSSGTFTVPSGVYSAEFLIVGAGGGGGGCDNSEATRSSAGGGGGGGAVKQITLPVTPGSSYTITIGAKGTGGAIGAAGANGGFSEVLLGATSLMKAFGGLGGEGVNSANQTVGPAALANVAGGGGGSLISLSALVIAGGGGGAGLVYQTNLTIGGFLEGSPGGASNNTNTNLGQFGYLGYGHGGGGGRGSTTTIPLSSGQAPYGGGIGAVGQSVVSATNTNGGAAFLAGCGGGGAYSGLSTTGAAGGDGADGLVRITYFA